MRAYVSSLVFAGAVALVLGYGGGQKGEESAARTACRDNLKGLYIATLIYAGDSDAILPISPWMDNVAPYLNDASLRCPAVPAGGYGYALNADLLGRSESAIASPDATAMVFDVADLAKNVAVAYPSAGVTRHEGPLRIYASGRIAPQAKVRVTPDDQRAECLSNLKHVATGMMIYTSDYDDRFPTSRWTDAVTPYLGLSRERFKCPAVPAGSFGYAMNAALLGASLTELDSPATVPALFDSNVLTRNAATPYAPASPARHGGDNVTYADGHGGTVP